MRLCDDDHHHHHRHHLSVLCGVTQEPVERKLQRYRTALCICGVANRQRRHPMRLTGHRYLHLSAGKKQIHPTMEDLVSKKHPDDSFSIGHRLY